MINPIRRGRAVVVAVACLLGAVVSGPATAAAASPAAPSCGRSVITTGPETALLARTIGTAAARQVGFQVVPGKVGDAAKFAALYTSAQTGG